MLENEVSKLKQKQLKPTVGELIGSKHQMDKVSDLLLNMVKQLAAKEPHICFRS